MMEAQTIHHIIIAILLFDFLTSSVLNYLNAKSFDQGIPEGLADVFNAEDYAKHKHIKKPITALEPFQDSFPSFWF